MAILPDILELLGETMGVSRAYVFENDLSPEGRLLATSAEWAAPGIRPQIDNPAVSTWTTSGRASSALSGSCLQASRSMVSCRSYLKRSALSLSQNIRSLVVVPIFSAGRWWGFLGLDECLHDWEWQSAEIEALRSAANALGAAFARQNPTAGGSSARWLRRCAIRRRRSQHARSRRGL
jgi:GAF domain-containing protein